MFDYSFGRCTGIVCGRWLLVLVAVPLNYRVVWICEGAVADVSTHSHSLQGYRGTLRSSCVPWLPQVDHLPLHTELIHTVAHVKHLRVFLQKVVM